MAGGGGKAPVRGANNLVEQVLETIKEQLGRLKYGSICLTIHEGKVVQLEIIEKKRLA